MTQRGIRSLVCIGMLAFVSTARAELDCAPIGAPAVMAESDRLFVAEVQAWSGVTRKRYVEGTTPCQDVTIAGYEGFPTKHCRYTAVSRGDFPRLDGEAIVLNPSARQLAAWGIHACRVNGASPTALPGCLAELRAFIQDQNGAQFAVVGSVIEDYCSSSGEKIDCKSLARTDRRLRLRHTWFRDGISADYRAAQGVRWDGVNYGPAVFDAMLCVNQSDRNLSRVYSFARVASASREDWLRWRKHIGQPERQLTKKGDIPDARWREISAAAHKAACRGASNDLVDALVFAKPSWTKR